jgi:large subunit ribosomal protein L24e
MYVPKKCVFCGKEVRLGSGILFVKNDGSTRAYCSSKCKTNDLKLGRDPRNLKWARRPAKK